MKAHIFVGLGFGDEGKGSMVDYACRANKSDLVVRFNGGSQAGHNVVTDDGKHHLFSQIGAGAFVRDVRTLLSKYMMWNPISLAHEVEIFSKTIGEHALNRHFIDERAPVITPYHVIVNRVKEQVRGASKHGSCGKGVGELAYDLVYHPDEVIRAGDLSNIVKVEALLKKIQLRKLAELEGSGIQAKQLDGQAFSGFFKLANRAESGFIADALNKLASEMQILTAVQAQKILREARNPVFEGAQGMLLDEWHGFHPYTTWSTTTSKNAHELLRECGFRGEVETTGILRSYTTRHGVGPFVTENAAYTHISTTEHNQLNDWQGGFRSGPLDGVLLRYAVECARFVGGLDNLALTHLDILENQHILHIADSYTVDGKDLRRLTPQNSQDLAHQEQLTALMLRSRPASLLEVREPQQLQSYIEKQTDLPVHYASFGPCAAHKHILKS